MKTPTPSFDNPDYFHLKSLSDMLKNVTLWAQAADAQVQILLAKRAPMIRVGLAHPPEPSSCDDDSQSKGMTSPSTQATNLPTTKSKLYTMAESLGIPETLLATRDYLNGSSKPTSDGIKRTRDLISKVLDKIAMGEDPSELWASPPSESSNP